MKTAILILLAGIFSIQANAQSLRDQFKKQVEQSCKGTMVYGKKVTTPEKGAESKIFDMNCGEKTAIERGTGKKYNFSFADELVYTLEYSAEDPYLKDYFDIRTINNEVFSERKESAKNDTPLEYQRVLRDASTGMVREIETRVFKDSWLYNLTIQTVVKFDAQGNYLSHDLRMKNDVVLSGLTITDISGWIAK